MTSFDIFGSFAIFLRAKKKNSKFLRGILCWHFDLFSEGLKFFKAHGMALRGECNGAKLEKQRI